MAINTVVEMEVAHYLIQEPRGSGKDENGCIPFHSPWKLLTSTKDLAKKSIELLAKFSQTGIGGRDATILLLIHGSTWYQEANDPHDRAFKRIDKIEVIDPIGLISLL